jgi:ribosomal protein L7/L12
MIEAEKMKDLVRDEEHWNDLYPDEIANIMVNANRIWKIRNKIKSGELPNDYLSDVKDLMEDYIKQGQKIAAIKLYRQKHDCTLREAKEYCDTIQKDLQQRGIMR